MKPRTIVITGGSGKLGRAIVEHFLSRGDCVITTCRTDASRDRLTAELGHHGKRFAVIRCDLTEPQAAGALTEEMALRGERPHCLINNARSLDFLAMGADGVVSRDHFASEFLLDVIAPYELTMALALHEESALRKVINVGSVYGVVAATPSLYEDPNTQSPVHYSVAKAALIHLTKELAVRLSGRHIQVNCVAFSGVEGRVDETFKARYARLCPMGRMLTTQEVVGPIDMLASEQSSGVTGHTFVVDGGWSIW